VLQAETSGQKKTENIHKQTASYRKKLVTAMCEARVKNSTTQGEKSTARSMVLSWGSRIVKSQEAYCWGVFDLGRHTRVGRVRGIKKTTRSLVAGWVG
jgi:hypothetical protein